VKKCIYGVYLRKLKQVIEAGVSLSGPLDAWRQLLTGGVFVHHTLIPCINPIRRWHWMLTLTLTLTLFIASNAIDV